MELHNSVYTHSNFGWPVERVAVLVLSETSHFHWKHTFGIKNTQQFDLHSSLKDTHKGVACAVLSGTQKGLSLRAQDANTS